MGLENLTDNTQQGEPLQSNKMNLRAYHTGEPGTFVNIREIPPTVPHFMIEKRLTICVDTRCHWHETDILQKIIIFENIKNILT